MNIEDKIGRRQWFKVALNCSDNLYYLISFGKGIIEDKLPYKEKKNYIKKINHKIKTIYGEFVE